MSQNKGNYAPVNGLKMYYEIYGKGAPLVLIHGGGSTIDVTWGRIIPQLAQHHQVIAVEMQAHGRTADIDRPFSFEQDADDIAALLQYLHIPKADIFGFSNGGQTTLQVAIRHPEVVNRIIVASAFYKKAGAYPWLWDFLAKGSFEGMPQPLKDAFLKVNPSQEALRASHDRDLHRMQHFQDMKETDIKNIKAPTLILCGDHDVITPEHAVEMFRQIPGSRLMILPGGHGEYLGELLTLSPAHKGDFAVVPLVESFLN